MARRLFAAKTPFIGYWISLDFLGFSRPKSRLINGLHGINRQKFFTGPFSVAFGAAGTVAHNLGAQRSEDRSWGKLTLISDFQQ